MLKTVIATGFTKKMQSGRNEPLLLECEDDAGNVIDVVVKYSGKLTEGTKSLAHEALAAMLAADLGLPVPKPFVVELTTEFISSIEMPIIANAMRSSCRQAFGSSFLTGMATWLRYQNVTLGQTQVAAEIAVFDQIIVNSDRSQKFPNLLFTGDNLAIIDHEMAFSPEQIIGWRAPWIDDGLADLQSRELHIFGRPYIIGKVSNLERFGMAWESLPPTRFDEYLSALPSSWVYDEVKLRTIFAYLNDAKLNINTIIANALKVFM